ncbi:AlpA family phage regulatory protein [Paraburkholderia sp. Ac-20336]|uniref:helix-turn-helix transcriptional regulator n=1 Tax=Paraburkholderia sp. Ac-20336 TaxID=2703886 RepID=UPI001981395E|nr:AlpA family phage regulatory protein [Paraburkholderia sp. Ac-20336]MBN3803199.1 AlpA family phage regulatory protein [Paraburkholderia sp. Ac-20336]
MTIDRLIDLIELCRQVCLSRSAVYERMTSDPTFPRIIKCGRKTLFSQVQVQAWIQDRIKESEAR